MSQSPYKGFNSHDLVHEFVEESYQSPYKGFNRKLFKFLYEDKESINPPYKGFNRFILRTTEHFG